MPQVQSKFLDPYITSKVRHEYYDITVEKAEAIDIHASGKYPEKLIGERRPAESKAIQEYRKKIFVPKTKPVFNKIYNSLMKIPRSPDFSIMFDDNVPSTVAKGETLKDYISEQIPIWGSVSNWFWSICFRHYLIDANAVVLTMPNNFGSQDNVYYKPVPLIFTSDRIIDYKEGEYYILQSSDPVRYQADGVTYSDGVKYYVVQPDVIQAFDYMPRKSAIIEVMNEVNVLGYMPIRSLRGICTEQGEGYALYESRIDGIVPMLNEVLREYSDLQAEVVQHIHSTMWTLQPQECKQCKGTGRVPKENSAPVPCSSCNGVGLAPMNPFEHLSVPLPKAGEPQSPTPPMGYVEKNTDIARLQAERIADHTLGAYAAINMEYLADVPLQQSGVAKQVDREELYSFVHSVATDCVRVISEVIYDINGWRYKESVTQLEKLESMLPAITIPERFDLLSATVLIEELKGMIEAKVDPAIVNATQIDLVEKRFASDPTVRDTVKLKLKLDPFSGVNPEVIAINKTYGTISELDMITNANIDSFVNRAMEEDKAFALKPIQYQKAIIMKYALEKQKEIEPIEKPDETIDRTDVVI
jgi:hypothetical protein